MVHASCIRQDAERSSLWSKEGEVQVLVGTNQQVPGTGWSQYLVVPRGTGGNIRRDLSLPAIQQRNRDKTAARR